ncbi:LysM peptidoglycan-binding domain-containing protein [Mesorhizobium sp. WSM4303]|uniref:LysM peptidoglycan-binding domain-containing protein n=1 Tax=unclassified Mesorhizobium TaxID=325217 RepID=UPI00115E6696|nr:MULTISPECIES: LysM peptidoglycan-binding domain-containing protein [unclassified Mesorhizobium]TRC93079.1 LysM peptidoglycan-binding domain-containing protein [Mesorhizobium sp. WSM4306]TRD02336.1 LysM peptidoglycan-binding domain-containing protein [Mesorhizobium sp. WSM4303]
MVRSITLTKPPLQPQKVNATANAEQIARLEAQAAKLREQIRLANRMGERDWAAQARQELAQVNTQLSSLRPPQVAAPAAPALNASNGTSGNGTTVTPALYVRTDLAAPTLMSVKLDGSKPEDNAAEATTARNIVNDVTGGKSIDQIASARGMTRDQVIAALRSGGMTVSTTNPTSDNGDVQATKITDASGHTVTQYYDYQHDSYYTSVEQPNGTATTTPIRDGLGRKETSSRDPDTGAITTRYEDDLGTGTVTERTSLPNGASVETVTPGAGPSLPVTTVTGPDGHKTILAYRQDPGGKSTQTIKDGLADGKSIEQIAQENGLTSEQVIAELQAAGYQVKTSSNSDVQSVEIVEAHTGDKTVYSHDYQHDTRTVVTTADGKETSRSVDGNGGTRSSVRNIKTGETTTTTVDPKTGTETKTVTDKDGRVTTTTTEKINDGKPVEYEVKPGDKLSLIARKYGVTLDDLRRTNPELFSSARDPNVIHAGEKITIENGTRTTVEVTFNGYTLTTRPDGSMTLHNDTTGSDLKIEVGTAQQALAELLMKINPQSKEPEQAKTDTVLKTTLEGVLGGASPELAQEVADKQQAVKDATKKYGGSKPATPNLDGSATSVGPFGEPPSATAPSGGKWVPLMVDGSWRWFDPEVAKAIAAENAVIARLGEAQAKPEQSAAQLDVYALDPDYKGAMKSAETTLDKVLAPYGLQWQAPEPKGTLADAQKRLTTANSMLQSASTARAEYAQGEKSLLDALGKQATLPILSDPSKPSVGPSGGPSREETNLQGRAEHAGVTQLFINAALHTARGNKATIDQMVSATELELYGVKSGSPEYAEINGRLEGLKGLQEPAASQVTLAEAYEEFGVAQKDAADLAVNVEPIKQALVAQAKQRNPHHFDWNGYTNGEGDFTGKLKSQEVIEENGQLYLVNTYENDVFSDKDGNDTPVLKYALTYDLGDKNIRDDFRNNPLNKQWQELLASTQSSASAPVCTPNGTGSQSALAAAKSRIVGVQVEQFDAKLKDAKAKLVDATTARDKAITEHGGGTVEAPAGTLQAGEKPVKITMNGRELWVAPEVAAAYEKSGPGAIGASGKSVRIEMDGQWLWVHPEVAAAEIDRGLAETEKTQLETWEKDVRPAMVAARDWYGFYASNPKLLTYGNEEHEARLKNTYFEEHKDQALAGYQVRLKQLYDNGFTGEYKQYKPGELRGTVARTLGLDESSEGVTKVTGEITDRAGENAEVKVVPIFSLDGGMESSTALFAIKNDGKEIGYVDSSGKYYGSFDEFQHENRIFSQNGKLILAKGGDMKLGADGFSLDEVEVADARKVDFWDKATDIGLGIVAGAATIVSFVPGGQWAIPIAITSGAALGGKTLYKEGEHLLQGGDFDSQSAWNVATGVTAFLPVGAGALRTFGLARAGLSTSEAFAGGFGMARMSDASWGVGKLRVNVTQSSYAEQAASYLQSGSKLTNTAWGLDAGGVVTGIPVLARSAEDLARHGGEMSFAELANAIMGIGTGAVGTGLGGRSLLYNMPGAAGPRGGDATPAPGFPPPGGPDSGPRPRAVYAMGQDGVYRPTGEYVMPDPNEIVIQGEVIGETSGQPGPGFSAGEGAGNPVGQRALPAGKSEGQNQPPPTGDKNDPSGNSQPSRPIALHEPSEGAGSSDPTMLPGRDSDGLAVRSPANPTDGDPIIVSSKPTATEVPVHLVWDPETRSFTGTPERDTGGYVYTSGKDPKTPSAYLDGLTTEQLVTRYEQEKGYYSSREMAERYGPDGVQIPRTPLGDLLPDFRVGVTFRTRLNTGDAFGIGSPTIAAVGFGVGTKTDFGMIGWSIVDSVSQRSLSPFKDALGTQGVVSYRAREYRNITSLQAGVWPVSNQTAFPVRSSDLSAEASKAIFSEASGYDAKPLDAAIVGMTPDGEGTVIEMTYAPLLKGEGVTLAPGQHDFFGVPAENRSGHVELQGALPFDRVMTETKAGIRLPIVANHVAAVGEMPRVGFERRPELSVKDTLQPGDIVSTQTFDQIQSALGSTSLKIQFAVKDPAKASELIAAIGQGDGVRSIRDLVKSGQVDPSNTVSFVDEPTLSGLRLSAVPGKAPTADIVLLTGEKARVVNPEAMLVDVIFNDRNTLPGMLGSNPDRMVTSAAYKVKSTVQSWLPARFQPDGSPQSRYMPSAGNIYQNLYGSHGAPATRYTLSLSTPPLPAGAVAFSAEVRIQYKSKAASIAPSIARNETATLTFDRADGQTEALTIPAWLAHAMETSRDGAATGIPKGGKASLEQFLGELEKNARPDQRAAIEQFRTEFGPSIVDGGFMRQNVADGVLTLLSSQVGTRRSGPIQIRDENGQSVTATRYGPLPRSAENVYVPPADGPPARGDEPELMHKSHILFRDPETGETYVLPWVRGASEDHVPASQGRSEGEPVPPEAMPARKAIEAAPPTTYSLQQVRNMRQPEKWKAGEIYTRELNGSLGEAHFPVDANPGGSHPVSGVGGRYVDSPVFKSDDVIEAIEVKTYHRWTTINGVAQMREVPLTPKLQEQINKDVALRNENPRYQPRWVFLDAPPSADLQRALDDAGIVGNIFGHNKPAAAKPQLQSATAGTGPDRTLRLEDESGKAIIAAILGTEPRGPEQVYVPPSDGPRAPADAPELADKTHILVYDPDTGEAVVLPWIRGASMRVPTGPEVRALSTDQISGLSGAQLHAIKPEHMATLTPEQVSALSPEQIGQLTLDQLKALRPKQLRALSAEQLQAIGPGELQAVAPGRISGLRPDQVAALSPEQIAALTIEQVHKLTPDQVAKLGDDQRNAFTPEQFAAMRPAQFGHLDATQFAALKPDLVAAHDPATTAKLSPDHISALTPGQLGALTIHQVEALTKEQIAALTPKQLGALSPGQLRKFTPTQFAWMSTEQMNDLSVLQLTTYRATHKKAMTPVQATSVDLALSHARMRENAQALATFGGMSTTSYALWSSLPPTWTATAGAVAFGVRGLVFGAQAVFPNATAGNKPFGRFLNALGGATFIAAAPGAATGMIQGKDLVVNSTFTLGNIVYGTKSMLQSFTGRPVIRNVAEHLAGPGYVLGCAVYTLHSWPAPIATVAGTLFTFGCAEFWASAIRTDRMNRRSVPRTDADIAAAEKSDKRWGTWDRWTLGITFGVGMLLFSLDSLLTKPWEGAPTSPPDPKKPDGDASSQQPDNPSDVPPQTPPEDFPQLVVLADDGLNLRTQPDGDSTVATVLQPGTFVEQTAKPSTDPSGEAWIPVEGFGPDGKIHSGWVSGDYVEVHPEGSSNPEGRTNPTLEKDGYQWVEVKDGDSIRLIARTHSADVAQTVVLNMDHILSPDMIFSGDRIYLPAISVG